MTLDEIESQYGGKARKAAEEIAEQAIRTGATMAFQAIQTGQFTASMALQEMHSIFLRSTLDEISRQINPPMMQSLCAGPIKEPSGTSEGR